MKLSTISKHYLGNIRENYFNKQVPQNQWAKNNKILFLVYIKANMIKEDQKLEKVNMFLDYNTYNQESKLNFLLLD